MTTKHLMIRMALWLSCLLLVSACFMSAQGNNLTPGGQPLLVGQRAFRPYGYFSLVGKLPRGFENFDTIQYWRKEDELAGPDISERTSGVNETGGVVYKYATISITRRKFVFTTTKVKGISYNFSGRFLRSDFVDGEMDLDKPVLVGTLGKHKNGKRVAEAVVKLSYFAGT